MAYTVRDGKLIRQHKGVSREGKHVVRTPVDAKPKYPADKGQFLGHCNMSSCLAPLAVWYNFSTQAYYCDACGPMLNRENYKDAHELYGHDLCLRGKYDAVTKTLSEEGIAYEDLY